MHLEHASIESFVAAATSGRCGRARRLLDARPEIAADPWAKLVLGRGRWEGDAVAPGGPIGWAPLLYVAHSCFASVELARDLLARGADPNTTFTNEYGEMSALYGAAGVVHHPELTRLLLEHGANPDDGESLYHATEAPDSDCLRILLEHGASPACTNALAHAIDGERIDQVTLLLDAGADPNEGTSAHLVHAVRRFGGPELLRLLAARGAELDRLGGEWSTSPEQYRTAYQNAVLRGRDDLADVLAELGADTTVAPEDLAVAALARGERPATDLPRELSPDAQEVLVLAALRGRLVLITDVMGAGWVAHCGGGPPGTLLHHACWVGNPAIVRRLLELGADPVAPSGAAFDTPIAWAALGSQWYRSEGRDYVAVVETLLAAGASLEERFAEVAEGPLAEWLEERGVG